MWQLKWVLTVAMLLMAFLAGIEANPSHHFDHQNLHQLNHLEALPLPYGLTNHFDFAPAPVVEGPLPWLPSSAPAPAPAPVSFALAPPNPLVSAPVSSPLVPAPIPSEIPVWTAQALPVVDPAPPVFAPAPFLPAPAPILPTHTPTLPAFSHPIHQHLSTVTQVLPPILEAVPFAPSYRAIPGPKTTTTKVAIGYAFPKLLATPHAHLKALPLKLAHHHHHSLF